MQNVSKLSVLTWRYSSDVLRRRPALLEREEDQVIQHGGEFVGAWSGANSWAWTCAKESSKTLTDTEAREG